VLVDEDHIECRSLACNVQKLLFNKMSKNKMLFSKEKSKYNIPSFSILDEHIIRLKQLSNTFGLSSYSLIRSKMKAILSDAICMIET
jgi:hypothetical protein